MFITCDNTYPLPRTFKKCPSKLMRGFLSIFIDYLEDKLDLMQLVSNLGFPAIVTMYLLIRIEGKLENLSTSINSLSSNINELNSKK